MVRTFPATPRNALGRGVAILPGQLPQPPGSLRPRAFEVHDRTLLPTGLSGQGCGNHPIKVGGRRRETSFVRTDGACRFDLCGNPLGQPGARTEERPSYTARASHSVRTGTMRASRQPFD